MAALGRVIAQNLSEVDRQELALLARSRSEAAGRVERARILLALSDGQLRFMGLAAMLAGVVLLMLAG